MVILSNGVKQSHSLLAIGPLHIIKSGLGYCQGQMQCGILDIGVHMYEYENVGPFHTQMLNMFCSHYQVG